MHRTALALVVVAVITAGCTLLPGSVTPQPTSPPAPTPTNVPSATPAPGSLTPAPQSPSASVNPSSSPAAGFYLRGWYTQAIAPQYTFPWLPPVTISDGVYINGNVAVPAIFPGPLLILPVSRSITDVGVQSIIDDAHSLGLLEGNGDFTGSGALPGAKLAQLELLVDGVKHELTGDPGLSVLCDRGRCTADPGTPQAFTALWNELGMLDLWMPDQLGASSQYTPERVVLRLTDPGNLTTYSPAPTIVDWPLSTPLASATCVTLSGDDLTTLLPVLESANQLTIFADGTTYRQPTARALVPGEPSPCDAAQ